MRSTILAAGIPLRAADVELSEPLDAIPGGWADDGTAYTAAVLLARLHGVPLGEVTVALPTSTQAVIDALRVQLGVVTPRLVTADSRPGRPVVSLPVPTVSVVIATLGRPALVGRCVGALLASDHDFEVIVVDNDPSDPSTAQALRPLLARDRRLRYVAEPVRGCSRARNTGIAEARGDIVAFTDDDVVVDLDWVPSIARTFAADARVACVTGLTLPYRLDTAAQRDFERVAGFSGGFQPRRFHLDMSPRPTRLFPFTPGVAGCSNNLAVRAEVLRRIGGFDVRLGPGTRVGGAEDLDLLTRVFLAGETVRYEPCVLVRHEHRVKDGAVARQIFSYGSGATALLMKWSISSPALRRQIYANLWSIVRDLRRVEVVREGSLGPDDAPAPQNSLLLARTLGYLSGPLLWLMTIARSGRRS